MLQKGGGENENKNMNIYRLARINNSEPIFIFVFQPYTQIDEFGNAFYRGLKKKMNMNTYRLYRIRANTKI